MVRFVVMAAGQATRMGQDKLMLPWRRTTVLGSVLETVIEALGFQDESSTEIYVVARRPIQDFVSENIISKFKNNGGVWSQVSNPQPLADTIRLSLQDLKGSTRAIGFLPGDQVGVTAQGLAGCLWQVQQTLSDFLVPMAGDQPGSPVFFHRKYVPELLALQGEQGGKEVLNRYPERWKKYTVEASLFQDVDTPEEYQALLETREGT
ncbi:MAG: nucleotidyltransferase family protein [Bacillota bacterium]|nr:nucleotidyltransferase family protein [Bacillota bacterium]